MIISPVYAKIPWQVRGMLSENKFQVVWHEPKVFFHKHISHRSERAYPPEVTTDFLCCFLGNGFFVINRMSVHHLFLQWQRGATMREENPKNRIVSAKGRLKNTKLEKNKKKNIQKEKFCKRENCHHRK